MTLASLAAASASSSSPSSFAGSDSSRCSYCRVRALPPLPSSLSGVAFHTSARPGHYRCTLSAFLQLYTPSAVGAADGDWLCVHVRCDSADAAEDGWRCSFGEERLLAEWAATAAKSAAALRALSLRSGCRSGKWLLRASAAFVDAQWRRVAAAVALGRLPGVRTAKVSSRDPPAGNPAHVACVYTQDWTDEADVRSVRAALRERCGVHWRISYKPDIYTLLGIFAKNKLKIKPTVYTE